MRKSIYIFSTPGINPSDDDILLSEEMLSAANIKRDDVIEEWRYIAPLLSKRGWLIPEFKTPLRNMCVAVAEINRLEDFLLINGHTYETETRNGSQIKMRPEVGQLNEVYRRYNSLAGSFGLMPAQFKLLANSDLTASGNSGKQLDLTELTFEAMNQGLYAEETYAASSN